MIQPREVRQVLAELELVSNGKCQSFNASGKPAEGHARPFGDSRPEFTVFRERFDREGYSERLLQEARTVLASLRRQAVKPKGETSEDDLIDRILNGDKERHGDNIITQGWSPQEVARWAGVTPRFVMRVRELHGLDQLTGRPLGMTLEQLLDRNPKITVRHAASALGVSRMTAHRRMQQVKRLAVAA